MTYLLVLAVGLVLGMPAFLAPAHALSERVTHVVRTPFQEVVATLQRAVTDQKMALVCEADAQKGAAARGVQIRAAIGC